MRISTTLLILLFFPLALSAAPEVSLRGNFSLAGSKLTLTITPAESAADCSYTLYAAARRNALSSNPTATTNIITAAGASVPTKLTARDLKGIDRSGGVPFFLRVLTNCSGSQSLSNIQRLTIRPSSSGLRNMATWLAALRRRIIPGSLILREAFPGITFSSPVDIQYPGDESDRLLIVEQAGRIQLIKNLRTNPLKSEFLDIRSLIVDGGERGLLGLAFHPDFATNGYFFVNYTREADGATVIARFRVANGNNDAADPESQLILLTVQQPFENHNGGALAFGPDGYLYIGLGDGGSGGDPQGNGQDRTKFLGKILRIDVDHTADGKHYAIPSDNPFASNAQGFKPEIFAFGLRNPWRFSFDSQSGLLWAGDVGQNEREEIDLISNGHNYGWNTMEGTACYQPSSGCSRRNLTLPVHEYSHQVGGSITGGYVYRGTELPGLVGKYIYGDFVTGRIWALTRTTHSAAVTQLFDSNLAISTFGVDSEKELYVASYVEGKLYKFAAQ
ncbi:MAG: PQQ-dependent sugar dehydrogenase [Oligoflexia bacterium]|nr:PQQ-dependent sugar dehydrogenase [Oligoflexia bacterium]